MHTNETKQSSSQVKKRLRAKAAYEAALRIRFREDCERYNIPTTRREDVWIAPYFQRQHRRAIAEAKANLAGALEAQKMAVRSMKGTVA